MTSFHRLHLFALPLALVAVTIPVYAAPPMTTIIDFTGLGGANDSVFSSYSEGGYTVNAFSGTIRDGQNFGDPVPDLFFNDPGATIDIQKTTADSDFIFDDADFGNFGEEGSYAVTGFLDGAQVFTDAGTIAGSMTFADHGTGFDPSTIDDLRITVQSAPGGSSNVDNIRLTAVPAPAVPEPGSIVLLATGLIGVFGTARRRFRC